MQVRGVDGCRGRWIVADVEAPDLVSWTLTESVADWMHGGPAAIAVDIPIGLPAAGSRACDLEARRLLGRRGSAVFAAPVRAVLGCRSYAEAREVLAARGGPSMSAQAFGIVAAVGAVDAAMTPGAADRVIETHPEVSFSLMAGVPTAALAPKRTAAGAGQRLRLLARWLPGVLDAVAAAPAGVPVDDALDALACAWSAQRWLAGTARVLGDGARDARGLPMRIVA